MDGLYSTGEGYAHQHTQSHVADCTDYSEHRPGEQRGLGSATVEHQGIINIARGIFRAVTRKVFPQTTFEVHTATAVAAVRGTQWLGEVTSEATAITVIEGEVAVTHAEARIGGTVVLTPGQGTDVQGQQPPTAPRLWAAERVARLLQATTLP